ncbi:protein [Escherichia coli]|nr:protein [Escherichia coli]
MMSLWDALRMNMMISYQELVRTFLSTTKNPAKIKEAALLHICGKSTFREYCSTLAGAGVFRWVTDVNHNKRSYYAIDNTLLYIEDVENNKPLI